MIRRLGGAAVYPLLVGGGSALAASLLAQGAPHAVVVGATNGAGYVLVATLERLLPYRDRWNRPVGDVATDALHLLLSVTVAGEAGRQLALLARRAGVEAWPEGWPVALQLGLALVVAELGVYWLHRLQHRGGWLWRLHAVHHSAERLWFLNSARNHPLDAALSAIVSLAPLALLGAPPAVISLVTVFSGLHAALQHSNVDLRLGPLNLVLSAAEVHRWHHSRALAESNANYGQTLLVWDLVFGTRRVPPGEPPADVGLVPSEASGEFPRGWLGQVLTPFQRRWWVESG